MTWEPLVAGDRLIGQQADDHLAILARHVDDVDVAGMNQVGTHADVYFFRTFSHKDGIVLENFGAGFQPVAKTINTIAAEAGFNGRTLRFATDFGNQHRRLLLVRERFS